MFFSQDLEIPDLSGKVIVITGGSSGLGKETALQLAKHNPKCIYLTARTEARARAAMNEIEKKVPEARGKLAYLQLDLGSFESIRSAVTSFRGAADRLDILINNAGIMAVPEGLTVDGFEVQFGSNYVGPALFTKLLLPILETTAARSNSDVRIVNLSSELFKMAPKEGILFSGLKTPLSEMSSLARYGQSKLADFYFSKEYAKRYPHIMSVAVHPGVVNTGLLDDFKKNHPYLRYPVQAFGSIFFTDVSAGARTQLWVATTKKSNLRNGGFYKPGKKEYNEAVLDNDELSEKLWVWTENELANVI